MDLQFNTSFKKHNGKLVYVYKSHNDFFKKFVDSIPEGFTVDATFIADQTGRLSQLAFLHGGFETLAKEIGESMEKVKSDIKKECGFCQGEKCKSMGDMTKSQLDTMKEVLIQRAEFCGLNLR